ncbi:hypothetical protein [Puniceibacterium antarcticum]|uniref:hypothetical protein n=1 Tax=Puniceibacterium antarcticum TaxID=1206336 RepID=UPI0015D4C547|nr:hypothetical protein [Puniceibacterium antarcticum]
MTRLRNSPFIADPDLRQHIIRQAQPQDPEPVQKELYYKEWINRSGAQKPRKDKDKRPKHVPPRSFFTAQRAECGPGKGRQARCQNGLKDAQSTKVNAPAQADKRCLNRATRDKHQKQGLRLPRPEHPYEHQ